MSGSALMLRFEEPARDLNMGENRNIIETLRGKVREKLKNAKTEVSLDEGLSFFILSGEEDSALGQSSEQRSVNDSYHKHFSLGDNLQSFVESQDEDFMEEIIFPDLLEVKAADYEDDQEQMKKLQANIFVPSSSPVINQLKLPEDMMPRILEEEGFYIQKKPEIYKKTCNKMENRLLKLEEASALANKLNHSLIGKCWFEESGEIMSLPSPIRRSWNFRLNIRKEPLNPALKTIYRKAVKSDLESSIRNKMEGQREMYQLDLNIVGLQFSHHPLFNQEHVLCARLLQLYECFQDRQQQNLPQLLYEKLKALTDATKLANENLERSQLTAESLQDYYWQISNTKQLYDLERKKDFSLLHSILRTWKQIKSLRQRQGFTSTLIKLQFQRMKVNKCDEQKQEELSKMPETKKKTEGKAFKNGEKQESSSYLASEFDEMDIERIKPQLSFTAELTDLSRCSLEDMATWSPELGTAFSVSVPWDTPYQFVLESVNGHHLAVLEDMLHVPFLLEGNGTEELCLLTSGKLSYSLSWALDENGIPLTPVSQSLRSAYCRGWISFIFKYLEWVGFTPYNLHIICKFTKYFSLYVSVLRNVSARGVPGIPWLINAQKLFEWANEVRIDPNNPEYSDLMEFIMYIKHKGQDMPKYFRLEQWQDEFNFVSEEEMKKSKRFQLLQLRNAGQVDVSLLQQMPLYDREIPDVVFQEYESQVEKDMSISDVNSIIAQRINSVNFLKKMRRLIMRGIVKVSKFNLSDIVADYEEIVSASQLTHAVCKLLERRRKLKPQRKDRKKVAAQTICDGDIKILVRILRAYNIPMRKTIVNRALDMPTYLISSMSGLRQKETIKSVASDGILNEDTVHPFVEVSFQHTVYQTSIASGSHPCWNEEIKVDFILPGHDYNFSSLSKIKDNIYINIFDEMIIEKHEMLIFIMQNPLYCLLFQISGTFQVNIPPVLLGYTWSKTYVSPKEDYNGQNLKECTFLNIFATIEPQISYAICNLEPDKGRVAYVLTKETDECLLWNPLTGRCHKQFDPFCPLQSVDCLFDDENVWFNIQQNNTPMAVYFDYTKEGFWKQLLPKYYQGTKAQSIQVVGFPLQMPYTDVQSVIDAVYQTGIHSSEFPQTEFALAVYIHPYPNNILSVWVYLASLARHD
ncbi:Protein CC2D2B [Camelus dromedarius]|uniref:Protein CC2D2B n=2 Tax=Camelus dromedarius TaxID=9838 RepID=A0A5N4DJ22_CAMDR|nr:Protein CC2D2B [Camelus dromedarius]